jgi:hypothetical protein
MMTMLEDIDQEGLPQGPLKRPVNFIARGTSMHPMIPDGTPVLVEPLTGPVRPGDVLLVNGPAGVALHRVIGKTVRGPLLQGDSCRQSDGVFSKDDILGRCTMALRKGRPLPLSGPLVRHLGLLVAAIQSIRRQLP